MISEKSYRCRFAWLLVAAVGTVACDESGSPASPTSPSVSAEVARGSGGSSVLPLGADGNTEIEEFEVCKTYVGTPPAGKVRFDYTVDRDADGSNEIVSFVELGADECAVVHTYIQEGSNNGLQVQLVTVTEETLTGYSTEFVRTRIDNAAGVQVVEPPVAGNSASGAMTSNPDNGFLVEFINTEISEPGTGRFTGGINLDAPGVGRVRGGLTIHCDMLLSNNLEVNWPGHRFHMTEHTVTTECSKNADPNPPDAPLNTLIGVGTGRYDGNDGYTVEFTFIDRGEPGRNDRVALRIYPTAGGPDVLNVAEQFMGNGGNLQAHWDQPHGSNRNRP